MKNIWKSNIISDDKLSLNKMIEVPSMIIAVGAIFFWKE